MGYILKGIAEGYSVGFNPGSCQLVSHHNNIGAMDNHPEVVAQYIQEELEKGRVV